MFSCFLAFLFCFLSSLHKRFSLFFLLLLLFFIAPPSYAELRAKGAQGEGRRGVLIRSAAQRCVSGKRRLDCGNTGGHSVRNGRAGSADTAQAESDRRAAAAGTAGRRGTRAAEQGTRVAGSNVGTPAGAEAAEAEPKKLREDKAALGGVTQAVNRVLDGEAPWRLWRSKGEPPRP